MKVWHKVLVAPGVAIVFLLALGITAYSVLTSQQGTLAELFEQRFGNYQLAARSVRDVGEVHSGVYRLFSIIASLDDDRIKQTSSDLLARVDSVSRDIKSFAERPQVSEEERAAAEALLTKLAKYRKDVELAIDLSAGDVNTGTAAMQTADADFQEISAQLASLVEQERKDAEEAYQAAQGQFEKTRVALFAIVGFALVISIGMALLMSRRIVRPLREAIGVAGRIASGDLTSEIRAEGADETAQLSQALKNMNDSLKRIVAGVRSGTDMVATASREIAQGNADLSGRTEQQASALEETSASMQQMTATVGQNAQNAKKANELAAQASSVAAKGGAVVREAVGTMDDITEASKKIADIIGVIDGIAFQTNILALNAAVEAARAGEQGRGFAVVASEVRSLAQRSAAAAKEIKDLITDSVSKVDAGSRQVNDAGRTMEEVVESVQKVTSLIAEITAASQEQAQGIEQVSETVTQLEKVTQQNAAMVEEASAAAGSLEEQSRALSSAVAAFRLGEDPGQTLSVPRANKPAPEANRALEASKPVSLPGKPAAQPASAGGQHAPTAAMPVAQASPTKKPPMERAAPSAKNPEISTHPRKAPPKRKSNGHAEEGWQEF